MGLGLCVGVVAIDSGHIIDSLRKVEILRQAKWWSIYLQVHLFQLLRLALALPLERFPWGCVYASQFEVPGHVDAVEGAEGLSLEGGHVAVEVDAEVVPWVLLPS